MSSTSGGVVACVAAFVMACAGVPAPQPAPRAAPATIDEPAAAPAPVQLRLVTLPASGPPRLVDDSGERLVQGGTRFTLRDGELEIAPELSREELIGFAVGDAWLFVDRAHGRVLRSDTFLGPLREHGRVDAELVACGGQPDTRLMLRGSDGVLYQASASEPLAAVEITADAITALCAFRDPQHGAAMTMRGGAETSDGGETWQPVPPDRDFAGMLATIFSPDNRRETSLPQAIATRLERQLLVALGVSLPEGSASSTPLPDARCERRGERVAVCPSGVFVSSPSGSWTHVAAGASSYAASVVATDHERVLLGWGCHGEDGRLCVIEPEPPRAIPVDRALGLAEARALVGDTVYLGARDRVLGVNVHSGETRVLALPEGGSTYLQDVTAFADGTVFIEVGGADERRGSLALYRVDPSESSPVRAALPPSAVAVAMYDAQNGFAVDARGVVHRTEDGGDRWAPTDARHASPDLGAADIECFEHGCQGDGWMAIPARPDASPPTAHVRPGPEPPSPPRTLRCESPNAPATRAAVEHEIRRNKLHVSVQWETSSGSARASGFLRGVSEDGYDWRVIAWTDALAVVGYRTRAGDPRLVLATARGRVSPLPLGAQRAGVGAPPVVETLGGDLIVFLPDPHRIDARGRVSPIPTTGARPEARFSAVRSDAQGRVELGWWAATASGGFRVVTLSGRVQHLRPGGDGLTLCDAARPPARWSLRDAGPALPLRYEDRLGRSRELRYADVVIDAVGDGACLRSIELGGQTASASDGALVTSDGGSCRVTE